MRDRILFQLCRALIALASLAVPSGERRTWRREWTSELWHRAFAPGNSTAGARADDGTEEDAVPDGRGAARSRRGLVRSSAGALPHALWLRAQEWRFDLMWQDLKYAVRTHLGSPGFTAVAVLILGVGIGANAVVFSLVDAALFQPYPHADPDRLVMVQGTDEGRPNLDMPLSYPDFVDLRAATSSFEELAVLDWEPYNLRGDTETLWVEGGRVSHGFFDVLDVEPLRGRTFAPDDDRPGAEPVVVLSEGLWRSAFGGADEIVGGSVMIDGRSHTVIGIVPSEAAFPPGTRLWVPLALDAERSPRGNHWLQTLGLVKPGTPLEAADAEVAAVARRLEAEYPGTNRGRGMKIARLQEVMTGDVGPAFLVLLGAVGFLLLIVCANLANLLLARASTRGREMGVRVAMGASRTRVARLLLTETLLLAVGGTVLGIAVAGWGGQLVLQLIPVDIPAWIDTGLNVQVLAFTGGIALAAALLSGLAPALRASRSDPAEALKEGGRAGSGGSERGRLRSTLVAAEVALSLTLLVGAGLMIRSLMQLSDIDPGFETDDRVLATMQLSAPRFEDIEERVRFVNTMMERIRGMPGVRDAGTVSRFPLRGSTSRIGFYVEGQSPDQWQENPQTLINGATPSYFQTVGIPLLRGRIFTEADDASSPNVVVVNDEFARHFWPDGDAIGRRLYWGAEGSGAEIVGVVGSVRHEALEESTRLQMYVPYAQSPTMRLNLVVHARANAAGLVAPLRSEIRALDPNQAISEVITLDRVVGGSIWQHRLVTRLLWFFGLVAVVLAAVGIYGVVSYAVARRTREIGIRVALGAERSDVVALIVRQASRVVGIGLVVGLAAAFGLSRLMRGILYGVSATDPVTFLGVALLLALVAASAAYLPARRATRVDPVEALREE